MLTKGAIGNLVNRYRAVLTKCNLINTFGSLAVASMLVLGGAGVAEANEYNLIDENTTISSNDFDANVTGDSIFVVKAGSTLTIEDGTNITVTDKIPVKVTLGPNTGYDDTKKAILIVNGGTLKSESYFGISGNGERHNTEITINGGIIEGTHGIYHPQNGTLTVTGGIIHGDNTGIEMRSGKLNISGGEISGDGDPFEAFANGSGTTIQGAALAISQHSTQQDIKVTISNGTFTGKHYALFEIDGHDGLQKNEDGSYTVLKDKKYSDNTDISITGGIFKGKIYSQNVDNFIHGGTFNDLSALGYIGEAAEGTTGALVKLDKDVTLDATQDVVSGTATLDLNGKIVNTTGDALNLYRGASLTIKDSSGSDAGTVFSKDFNAVYLADDGTGNYTLTIESGTLKSTSSKYATIQGNGERHGSTINITGGKIISESKHAIYHPHEGTLNISGGHIEGGTTAVEVRGGKSIISGGTFISNFEPAAAQGNGNGSTVDGAAFAVSQHKSNSEGIHDVDVTISNGTFTGDYAFFEEFYQKVNEKYVAGATDESREKLSISITGGTFTGKIYSGSKTDFISGGTFSDESALKYLAPEATITVTDAEIASYENEDGDEHTITFGAEGGSKVESVTLADNSSTTFDGKAAITKMTAGDKTTLTINSADISAKESDLQKTEVKASGDVNDALGGAEGLAAQLGTTVDKIGSLNMEEGLISGAVVNGVQKTSTILKDTLEQATAAPLAVNRILMNDVRKRMGDLRDTKEDSGVWMRWDGGKLKGDEGLTNNFNTIQIGADMLTGIKNVRAGVAGSFTHGDVDHNNGDGEMEAYTFAAYGTWMADNGMFADVIARVGFNNTELNIKGGKADLDNEALSLSAEYGWRFDLGQQFFVEPQAELTYTHVTGADFTIKTASYDVDSMDSLLGRAGLAAGWKLPNERGNVYARASVVHEFLGDAEITGTNKGNSIPYELDGEDTWLEYGIGANVKLTDSTYLWADVERTEGADIEEEWRGTVGIRYSF